MHLTIKLKISQKQEHLSVPARSLLLSLQSFTVSSPSAQNRMKNAVYHILFPVQNIPVSSGIFLVLPVICWTPVRTFNMLRQMVRFQTWFWLAGIELLVLSFFHRFFLSGLLVALLVYEYIILKEKKEKLEAFFNWALNCLVLAVFPALPLVDKDSNNFTLL